jgi:hypothetical protein
VRRCCGRWSQRAGGCRAVQAPGRRFRLGQNRRGGRFGTDKMLGGVEYMRTAPAADQAFGAASCVSLTLKRVWQLGHCVV